MNFLTEFKQFAVKGNVVDMAVGIIVGAAFGKIVSSLVGDILMPPLGIILGGVDFSDLAIILKEATAEKPAVTVSYGKFFQTVIDFFIIALAAFVGIKAMNAVQKEEEQKVVEAPPVSKQEVLLEEIRDLLKRSVDR